VVYNLEADLRQQKPGRLIRSSRPSDRRKFLTNDLTPDGRFYTWVGPREPAENRRIEVYEIDAGRLLRTIDKLKPIPGNNLFEVGAFLSPDGQYLCTSTAEGRQIHELNMPGLRREFSGQLCAFSPNSRWLAFLVGKPLGYYELGLRRWNANQTWLELGIEDMGIQGPVSFSPDGRYLQWGGTDGTIMVADLPALEDKVGEFEKAVLSK
jgi:WD40 repeat protein